MENDMGVLGERLELVEILVGTNNRVHAELGFEDLGLLGIANDDADVKCARLGMVEEPL